MSSLREPGGSQTPKRARDLDESSTHERIHCPGCGKMRGPDHDVEECKNKREMRRKKGQGEDLHGQALVDIVKLVCAKECTITFGEALEAGLLGCAVGGPHKFEPTGDGKGVICRWCRERSE